MMKDPSAIRLFEFEIQAQKTIAMAIAICEERLKGNKFNVTPELKTLSTAALSLEKAIAVFIAAERLRK